MLDVKELNINSSTNIPYLNVASGSLEILQTSYLRYNNKVWIGGKENYTTGGSFIIDQMPTNYSLNPGNIGHGGFFICYYQYDWETSTWSQVDDVIDADRISVSARKYSVWKYGYVKFTETAADKSLHLVTAYNGSDTSYGAISTDITNAAIRILPYSPYTKSELDAAINSNFASFPNIQAKIKAKNLYGGTIINRPRILEYVKSNMWTQDSYNYGKYGFRQCATQQGGSWDTTGKPPCFNDDVVFMNYRTKIPVVILFASEEEYRAAMCVTTGWTAPFYPIT